MFYKTLSAPITVQVELTTACDNDCLYCYNHWRHDKHIPGANMHRDLLEKVVSDLIDSNVFQVTFTGGEVLLRKKELFFGLEQLIRAGVSCAVNSNLTMMTYEDATKLYELGLRGVMTSVSSHLASNHDHIFQRKGAFDFTMQGIENAQKAGLHVAVSMVVTSHNVDQVYETALAMKARGVMEFYATKASPPVNAVNFDQFMVTQQQLQAMLETLQSLKLDEGIEVGVLECYPLCSYGHTGRYSFVSDRRCSAGVTTCTIGADGSVRPCSHSDVSYGDIANEGLKAAWFGMTDQRDGSLLPETCKQCKLLSSCSGGCRVDAFCCNGSFDTLDPYASPERVSRIELPSNELELLKPGQLLMVPSFLRARAEEFGVLCASEKTMAMPALLTADTYALINSLKGQVFTAEDVSDSFDIPLRDAQKLCAMLVRDTLLVKA